MLTFEVCDISLRDNSNGKRDLAAGMWLSAGQVRSAIASRFCKQGTEIGRSAVAQGASTYAEACAYAKASGGTSRRDELA
jgi:hypothetical protein